MSKKTEQLKKLRSEFVCYILSGDDVTTAQVKVGVQKEQAESWMNELKGNTDVASSVIGLELQTKMQDAIGVLHEIAMSSDDDHARLKAALGLLKTRTDLLKISEKKESSSQLIEKLGDSSLWEF